MAGAKDGELTLRMHHEFADWESNATEMNTALEAKLAAVAGDGVEATDFKVVEIKKGSVIARVAAPAKAAAKVHAVVAEKGGLDKLSVALGHKVFELHAVGAPADEGESKGEQLEGKEEDATPRTNKEPSGPWSPSSREK